MKTIGETLRQIRVSKGLKLKDLAINDISATFISKVERNESNIRLNKFELLLDGLHVSYDEFKYIQNGYSQSSQREFLEKLDYFVINDNLYGIQKLYENEKVLIPEKNPEKSLHFHNMTLALCHIRKLQGKNLPQKYNKLLVKYLLSIDSWGIYELRLFNNAMFIFDCASLVSLTQTAIDRAKYYLQLPGYSDLWSSILSNSLELLIENHEFEFAQKLLTQAEKNLNFEKTTQSEIKIIFLESLIAEKQNAKPFNSSSPEDIITACYCLKAVNWADALNKYLQNWRKENNGNS
ncbi:helix-turn-helix domain-containing protein [Levilactobacillus namurensis]|uniref:helix-turn-helix domain-containing protein n=1 Tax=Levilactobacillus namurensis TaxID=380393 RepID=UPI0026EB2618|nr:Rgg/GadR/MutR family transcriptional regulator [Levilactobacillus namurensis]